MRWFWIDRITHLESGRRARAIKNVTLAEDHLHDHFPGYPIMPASLIIEGLAQTGGVLVGEARDFQEKVILAKIPKVTFHEEARPGDQLVYETEIVDLREDGARITGTATVGDRLIAEIEIVFVHLDNARTQVVPVDDNFVFNNDFMAMLEVMRSWRPDDES